MSRYASTHSFTRVQASVAEEQFSTPVMMEVSSRPQNRENHSLGKVWLPAGSQCTPPHRDTTKCTECISPNTKGRGWERNVEGKMGDLGGRNEGVSIIIFHCLHE